MILFRVVFGLLKSFKVCHCVEFVLIKEYSKYFKHLEQCPAHGSHSMNAVCQINYMVAARM